MGAFNSESKFFMNADGEIIFTYRYDPYTPYDGFLRALFENDTDKYHSTPYSKLVVSVDSTHTITRYDDETDDECNFLVTRYGGIHRGGYEPYPLPFLPAYKNESQSVWVKVSNGVYEQKTTVKDSQGGTVGNIIRTITLSGFFAGPFYDGYHIAGGVRTKGPAYDDFTVEPVDGAYYDYSSQQAGTTMVYHGNVLFELTSDFGEFFYENMFSSALDMAYMPNLAGVTNKYEIDYANTKLEK